MGLASESVKACKEGRTGKMDEQTHATTFRTKSEGEDKFKRDVDAPKDSALYEDTRDDTRHDLEDEWNLDDAQDGSLTIRRRILFLTLANWKMYFFANIYRPTTSGMRSQGKMPLPLVLPQRKPKDRSRGFIRAFAPVLENCGINQAAWLVFLDAFQKSSAASPWFNAINMASIGTIFTPYMIGLVVGYAIQQATNMAIELQARKS